MAGDPPRVVVARKRAIVIGWICGLARANQHDVEPSECRVAGRGSADEAGSDDGDLVIGHRFTLRRR